MEITWWIFHFGWVDTNDFHMIYYIITHFLYHLYRIEIPFWMHCQHHFAFISKQKTCKMHAFPHQNTWQTAPKDPQNCKKTPATCMLFHTKASAKLHQMTTKLLQTPTKLYHNTCQIAWFLPVKTNTFHTKSHAKLHVFPTKILAKQHAFPHQNTYLTIFISTPKHQPNSMCFCTKTTVKVHDFLHQNTYQTSCCCAPKHLPKCVIFHTKTHAKIHAFQHQAAAKLHTFLH